MNYICVGEIVNTHGIKGEVRLISNFERKDLIFKKNFNIYIGNNKEKLTINTYRVHKNFDMITLVNYDNINDVLKYKNEKVFINRDDFKFDEYLDEDLIGLDAYIEDKLIGKIESIEYIKNNSLIIIKDEKNNKRYIPNNKDFIKSIDVSNKKVYINYIEGLIEWLSIF